MAVPQFLHSVKLKYVKLGYFYLMGHGIFVLSLLLLLPVAAEMGRLCSIRIGEVWDQIKFNLASIIHCTAGLVFIATIYFMSRPRPVYLIDFACCKPPSKLKCSNARFLSLSLNTGAFNGESLEFQSKICERSGVGDEAYLPPAVQRDCPSPCMAEAREEAEAVMSAALDELFRKARLDPKRVGILIVNCSLFNPTPSLSAMLVNRYKLRGNIRCFDLSGMGCSAGVISIDLAKRLLQVHRSSYAVVVSTENITLNWYLGNDRSMLLSNCIFRMGAAAVLLSNRRSDRRAAKYEMVVTVRTHKGADQKSYGCVFQREDGGGKVGVALSKELMAVAGEALKTNITTLGPLVLPLSEQLRFFASLLLARALPRHRRPRTYIPDFKLAFHHFCIHAGGRAVLDAMERSLQLTEQHMEASRMTLHRFGNTSSSSLWYELAYTEAKGRARRGDRIWQIAFGSGFKCNSVVWRALRSIQPKESGNPWLDCIDHLPAKAPSPPTTLQTL